MSRSTSAARGAVRGATPAADTADREIVLTRYLDAPPERVWEAWSAPERVAQWWGPDGFSTTFTSFDLRAGGLWRFTMHGPDGRDYPNRIDFDEVVPCERLAYRHSDDGGPEGIAFHATVTFTRRGSGTEITLRTVFATPEARDRVVTEHGAIEGGKQTLARLAAFVAARD